MGNPSEADKEKFIQPSLISRTQQSFKEQDFQLLGFLPLIASPSCEYLQSIIPEKIFNTAKECYAYNFGRNALILNEADTIIKKLQNQNISTIALKGYALLRTIYPDIGQRQMVDVDILIKLDCFTLADKILKQEGYIPINPPKVLKTDKISPYLNSIMYEKTAAIKYFIHLHWHLVNTTLPATSSYFRFNIDRLLSEAISVEVGRSNILMLSPQHFLIHLCQHALKHNFQKLILLYDIHKLILHYGHRIIWEGVIREGCELNLSKHIYYSLYFTNEFFKTPIPDFVLNEFAPKKVSLAEKRCFLMLKKGEFSDLFSFFVYLSIAITLLDKIRFIFRTLFPHRAIVDQIKVFDENSTLSSFYRRHISRGLRYLRHFLRAG